VSASGRFYRDSERVFFIDELIVGDSIKYKTCSEIGRTTLRVVTYQRDLPIVEAKWHSSHQIVAPEVLQSGNDCENVPDRYARGTLIGCVHACNEEPFIEQGMLIEGGSPIISSGGVLVCLPPMDERIYVKKAQIVRGVVIAG